MSSRELPSDGIQHGEAPTSHFSRISHAVSRDRNLSNRAKGLFLNLASHRPGFVITEEFLASQSTDGVKAIRATLLELRQAGYVYRSEERTRYPKGTKNSKGKDISGALGPYRWFVTSNPDEVAAILARSHQEQQESAA